MECEEYKEQASSYVDGELVPAAQRELFNHLATCTECRHFLDLMMRIRKAASREDLPVPADVDEAVFAEIGRWKVASDRARIHPMAYLYVSRRHISLSVPLAAAIVAVALALGSLVTTLVGRQAGRESARQVSTIVGEDSRQPSAVVFIYTVPEVQSTLVVPAADVRKQEEKIY